MTFIAVVGAGPIGLSVAHTLKSRGWDVTLLEMASSVGEIAECTGLLSTNAKDRLNIPEHIIHNYLNTVRIVGPESAELVVSSETPKACVLDRAAFDRYVYEHTLRLGVEVRLNAKVIDFHGGTIFYKKHRRGELLKPKFVVAADGANSIFRKLLFEPRGKEFFVHAYQVEAYGSYDTNQCEIHFGSFAPGFFAWVVPLNEEKARIGVATQLDVNARKAFERFVKERAIEFNEHECENRVGGLIPIGPPLNTHVKNNVLITGDAAFHVKASTGGGLALGLQAAQLCADALSDHIAHKKALETYDSLLAPILRELKLHWRLRKYLNGLGWHSLDKLLLKLKRAGIEEFLSEYGDMDYPSRFIRKMFMRPNFWRFLPAALRIAW